MSEAVNQSHHSCLRNKCIYAFLILAERPKRSRSRSQERDKEKDQTRDRRRDDFGTCRILIIGRFGKCSLK